MLELFCISVCRLVLVIMCCCLYRFLNCLNISFSLFLFS